MSTATIRTAETRPPLIAALGGARGLLDGGAPPLLFVAGERDRRRPGRPASRAGDREHCRRRHQARPRDPAARPQTADAPGSGRLGWALDRGPVRRRLRGGPCVLPAGHLGGRRIWPGVRHLGRHRAALGRDRLRPDFRPSRPERVHGGSPWLWCRGGQDGVAVRDREAGDADGGSDACRVRGTGDAHGSTGDIDLYGLHARHVADPRADPAYALPRAHARNVDRDHRASSCPSVGNEVAGRRCRNAVRRLTRFRGGRPKALSARNGPSTIGGPGGEAGQWEAGHGDPHPRAGRRSTS